MNNELTKAIATALHRVIEKAEGQRLSDGITSVSIRCSHDRETGAPVAFARATVTTQVFANSKDKRDKDIPVQVVA